MTVSPYALRMLDYEARSLLTRLERLEPFSMNMPMVTAASVSPTAMSAIDRCLAAGRIELRGLVQKYLSWLRGAQGSGSTAAEAQRRMTILRLKFNLVLSQLDIFADVLTQRGECGTGVWIAGLDAIAEDALSLPGGYYEAPPVVCYLERGPGAAIRRARTRLPGGRENPCAVIRVPRERMIGSSGVASSLIHEVGHQSSALLDLAGSVRPVLKKMQAREGEDSAWVLFERWISEILADLWSVARLGVSSSLGLMAVVSLPRAFVFRLNMTDPHPFPYVRVKLSLEIGKALYPHPHWTRLAGLWESYYAKKGLDERKLGVISRVEAAIPGFVRLLVSHRPEKLRGRTIAEALSSTDLRPDRLAGLYERWRSEPELAGKAPPLLALAVIGQAKADGKITPEEESVTMDGMLRRWALTRSVTVSRECAGSSAGRVTGQGAIQRLNQ